MNKFKAVIFDIDGTLTPQVSWTSLTSDLGGSVADHLAIYEDLRSGKLGLAQSKAKLIELWQSTGRANETQIQQIFEAWPIRQAAYPLVEYLKAQGYHICLITGSLGIYAKHVAGKLGVEDYYANAELHFDAAGKIVDFSYETDQAKVKLAQLQEYCQRHNLQPQDCLPIGDSDNDLELFKATGNGLLINDNQHTSEELRLAAWKVVNSLQDVRLLI